MGVAMKDSGLMMFKKDKVKKYGLTEPNMSASTPMEWSMVTVSIIGQMEVNLKEIGKKTKLQDLEFISGKMVEYTKVTGNKIICTDKVFTNGRMVENMKEVIQTIRKKDMEFTPILTGAATEVIGKMENNMEKVYLSVQKESQEKASGKMENDYIGKMKWAQILLNILVGQTKVIRIE